jgi:hypothetical protein
MYKTNIQKTYLFLLLILVSLDLLGQSNGKVYILDDVANAETTTLGSKVTIKKGTPTSGSIFIAGSRTRDVKGDKIINSTLLDGVQSLDGTAVTALLENHDEVQVTGQLTITGCNLEIPEGKTLSANGANGSIVINVNEIFASDARILAENGASITVKACLWKDKQAVLNFDGYYDTTDYGNHLETLQTLGDGSTIDIYTGYTPNFIVNHYVAKGNGSAINIHNFFGVTELVTMPIADQKSTITVYSNHIVYANPEIPKPLLPDYLEPYREQGMHGPMVLYAYNPSGLDSSNNLLQRYDDTPGTIVIHSEPRATNVQGELEAEDFVVGTYGAIVLYTQELVQLEGQRTIEFEDPIQISSTEEGKITNGGGMHFALEPSEGWPEELSLEIQNALPLHREIAGVITNSGPTNGITLQSEVAPTFRRSLGDIINLKAPQIKATGGAQFKNGIRLKAIEEYENSALHVPLVYHNTLTQDDQGVCSRKPSYSGLPDLGIIHPSQMDGFLNINPDEALTSMNQDPQTGVLDFAGLDSWQESRLEEILVRKANRWDGIGINGNGVDIDIKIITSADYGEAVSVSNPNTSISLALEAKERYKTDDIILWIHYKGDANGGCPTVFFDMILPYPNQEIVSAIREAVKVLAITPMDELTNREPVDFTSIMDESTINSIDGGNVSAYHMGFRAEAIEEGLEVNFTLIKEVAILAGTSFFQEDTIVPKQCWMPVTELRAEGLDPCPLDMPGAMAAVIDNTGGVVISVLGLLSIVTKVAINPSLVKELLQGVGKINVVLKQLLKEQEEAILHENTEIRQYARISTSIQLITLVFDLPGLLLDITKISNKTVSNISGVVTSPNISLRKAFDTFTHGFPSKITDPFYQKLTEVIDSPELETEFFRFLGGLDKITKKVFISNPKLLEYWKELDSYDLEFEKLIRIGHLNKFSKRFPEAGIPNLFKDYIHYLEKLRTSNNTYSFKGADDLILKFEQYQYLKSSVFENYPYLVVYENIQFEVEFSAEGGIKDAFIINDELVMLKYKEGAEQDLKKWALEDESVPNVLPGGYIITEIDLELSALQRLNELGFPIVEGIGITLHLNEPGVINKNYIGGSSNDIEDYIVLSAVKPISNKFLRHGNEASIVDLTKIKKLLIENDIFISDMQFLIDKNGRVVLHDMSDFYYRSDNYEYFDNGFEQHLKYIDDIIGYLEDKLD